MAALSGQYTKRESCGRWTSAGDETERPSTARAHNKEEILSRTCPAGIMVACQESKPGFRQEWTVLRFGRTCRATFPLSRAKTIW
jgi:hypothetical protein